MRAVIIDKPGRLRVAAASDPEAGPGEVVVQVGCCGICGTDLHILDGEFPPTPYPIIPGHEFAGTVVSAGPGVSDLAEGTRVAVDPSLFCGRCGYCRAGRGNLCTDWGAIGDTVNGAFAQYVAVPAGNAYRLPADLGWLQSVVRTGVTPVVLTAALVALVLASRHPPATGTAAPARDGTGAKEGTMSRWLTSRQP